MAETAKRHSTENKLAWVTSQRSHPVPTSHPKPPFPPKHTIHHLLVKKENYRPLSRLPKLKIPWDERINPLKKEFVTLDAESNRLILNFAIYFGKIQNQS